eukprot:5774526-Pleurochrysis_carterae.AAC.1
MFLVAERSACPQKCETVISVNQRHLEAIVPSWPLARSPTSKAGQITIVEKVTKEYKVSSPGHLASYISQRVSRAALCSRAAQ